MAVRLGTPEAGRRAAGVLGLAVSLAMAGLSLQRPALLSHLDDRFCDGLMAAAPETDLGTGPVVVALDDESLARFGRWPWPHSLMARLLARLEALGPRAVGVDALFAESESRAGLSEGGRALATTLEQGPFVLAYKLAFEPAVDGPTPRPRDAPVLHPLNIVGLKPRAASEPGAGLWRAAGVVPSLPDFARAAAGSGFINAGVDPDGVLRRIPVLIAYDGGVYPSLALATVLGRLRIKQAVLATSPWGGQELRVAELRIPLDERGRLLLRFRGQNAGPKPVSAAAVLEGRVPRSAVEGRVVFVGSTASGLGESVSTPVAPVLAGVQVHAVAAANMLSGDFAQRSPALVVAALTLAAGLFSSAVCCSVPALRGTGLLTLGGMGLWAGAGALFRARGTVVSPVLPLTAMAVNFALLTLWRLLWEERRADLRTLDLAHTRDFLTESLTSLGELRHAETGAHIRRTQRLLRLLCEAAAAHPKFRDQLDLACIELVSKLAPLHDIGKVGVPDGVLLKPHRLTPDEFEQVKRHAAFGRDALLRAATRAGLPGDELLRFATDLVYAHHERWDGSGYPEGLRGEAIPLAGRLMALVDVYDALVTRRVYKDPVPHEDAVRIIKEGSGTQFDPDLVDAFLRVEEQWRYISQDLEESQGAAR